MAGLERGQFGISGEGPRQRPQSQRGGLILLGVVLAAIAAWFFIKDDTSTPPPAQAVTLCGPGSAPSPNCISPPPQPPGRTVYFTPVEGSKVAFAFVVASRSFQVIQVASREDIPNYSEGRIVGPGTIATEGQITRCNPCILEGDVNIDVGPIAERDEMAAFLQTLDADLTKVEVKYQPSSPRGPPLEGSAVLYVIGKITGFHGPDQFDRSRLQAGVLDLGTSYTLDGKLRDADEVRREEETFLQAKQSWVEETAAKLKVAPEKVANAARVEDVHQLVRESSPHPVAPSMKEAARETNIHPVRRARPGH